MPPRKDISPQLTGHLTESGIQPYLDLNQVLKETRILMEQMRKAISNQVLRLAITELIVEAPSQNASQVEQQALTLIASILHKKSILFPSEFVDVEVVRQIDLVLVNFFQKAELIKQSLIETLIGHGEMRFSQNVVNKLIQKLEDGIVIPTAEWDKIVRLHRDAGLTNRSDVTGDDERWTGVRRNELPGDGDWMG